MEERDMEAIVVKFFGDLFAYANPISSQAIDHVKDIIMKRFSPEVIAYLDKSFFEEVRKALFAINLTKTRA